MNKELQSPGNLRSGLQGSRKKIKRERERERLRERETERELETETERQRQRKRTEERKRESMCQLYSPFSTPEPTFHRVSGFQTCTEEKSYGVQKVIHAYVYVYACM